MNHFYKCIFTRHLRLMMYIGILCTHNTSLMAADKPNLFISGQHVQTRMAFSAKSSQLITVSGAHLKIWDIKSGREIKTLTGHSADITSLTVSSNGQYIATTGKDKTIRLWDAKKLVPLGQLSNRDPADRECTADDVSESYVNIPSCTSVEVVHTVKFTSNGLLLASAGYEGVKLWNPKTMKFVKSIPLADSWRLITGIAFSSNGKYLAVFGLNRARKRVVNVWSMETVRKINNFQYTFNNLKEWDPIAGDLDFSTWTADGRLLVSMQPVNIKIGNSDTISSNSLSSVDIRILYESKRRKDTAQTWLELKHSSRILSIASSEDGRLLALGGFLDGMVSIFNSVNGNLLSRFKAAKCCVTSLAFSQDGHNLATSSESGEIELWDISSILTVTNIQKDPHSLFEPEKILASKYFLKVNQAIAGKSIRVGETVTKKKSFGGQGRQNITALAFSPDGHVLAAGSESHTIDLWDNSNGHVLGTLRLKEKAGYGPDASVIMLEFGTDGRTLVTADFNDIAIWDLKHKALIAQHQPAIMIDMQLAVSPQNNIIAYASRLFSHGSIYIWNYRTKNKRLLLHDRSWSPPVQSGYVIKGDMFTIKSLKFSPDGSRLVTANSESVVRVWNTKTGTEEFAHQLDKSLLSASFSIDGTLVVAMLADKSLRRWRLPELIEITHLVTPSETELKNHGFNIEGKNISGNKQAVSEKKSLDKGAVIIYDKTNDKQLVKLIRIGETGWVAITPEGYYDNSTGADKYINVRIGSKVYNINQYRERFYRPEIVQAKLSGKALQMLPTFEDIRPAPSIAIVDAPAKVTHEDVTIKVRVTDEGGGVGNIRLYVDGTTIAQQAARDIISVPFKTSGRLYTFPIQLTAGKHQIKVIAFNADNKMRSVEVFHTIEANITKFKPTLHALIIGIDTYDNPKLNLTYAVADALLMEQVLKTKSSGYYKDRIKIKRLTTPAQTSKDAILSALKQYQTNVKPGDVFLFFVASHGTVDKDNYYLISSNVDSVSSHILKQNAINQEDLKHAIANIPATKKIILIDTCNAGKLAKELTVALLTRSGLLGESVGSVLLSASTSKQQAIEGYKKQGLFTYVVAEGLNGAANDNNDKYVYTDELVGYVYLKVSKLSQQHFKQKQIPNAFLNGNIFPLTLTR